MDDDDDVLLAAPRVVAPVRGTRPDVGAVADDVLVVHEVGDPEDPLRRDGEVVEQARVGVGRRRLGDRLVVVDVEGEPDLDAPALRLQQRGRDQLRGLLLEVEVVQGEIERFLGFRKEPGRILGDLECGLTSVPESAELDVRRSRGPASRR